MLLTGDAGAGCDDIEATVSPLHAQGISERRKGGPTDFSGSRMVKSRRMPACAHSVYQCNAMHASKCDRCQQSLHIFCDRVLWGPSRRQVAALDAKGVMIQSPLRTMLDAGTQLLGPAKRCLHRMEGCPMQQPRRCHRIVSNSAWFPHGLVSSPDMLCSQATRCMHVGM